ncbi:hypothetical protein EV182_003536 [Spiromyces aspiralis]|uniref:Uncharacterized protein n=1 Tax=Spiromyces aspiralis TaxID=68401 RepID=A0ACC1HDP5_9FUNG|nr:hypothetical protein EV182_003536 [Spiromyces aspiralis]
MSAKILSPSDDCDAEPELAPQGQELHQQELVTEMSTQKYTQVTRHNIHVITPKVREAIARAKYIAVDTEFTGLGLTRTFDSEFGFNKYEWDIRANIAFLVETGFDLNRMVVHGIPYYSAPDPTLADSDATLDKDRLGVDHEPSLALRSIMGAIITSGAPLILHNGLVDLMLMYHHFYAPLPKSLTTFMADILEMFKGGVWDTKFFCKTVLDEDATFLAYLYTKAQVFGHTKS